MFTVRGKRESLRIGGFTLLEIMLAVGILGLMSLAIFRFVQANMTALRLSSDTAARDSQYDGLRDLLTSEWQSLSPTRARMIGEPFKLNDRERDVITWICSAGTRLLTRYAPGELIVALRLQAEIEKSDRLDLGLGFGSCSCLAQWSFHGRWTLIRALWFQAMQAASWTLKRWRHQAVMLRWQKLRCAQRTRRTRRTCTDNWAIRKVTTFK